MKTKSILCLLSVGLSFTVLAQESETVVKKETIITTTTTTVNQASSTPETSASTPTPSTEKAKIWIGPKFGLDVSSTSLSTDALKGELNKNYQFGLLLQYGRILYIQPEIYYASYKVSETVSNNYIKVPLQVGLKFLDLGLFSLHITTGPSYTIKLDNTDKLTETKGFNWLVGAGVDVLGFITSDIRYTLRNNVSLADQISQFSSTSNTLNLTVGLKLR